MPCTSSSWSTNAASAVALSEDGHWLAVACKWSTTELLYLFPTGYFADMPWMRTVEQPPGAVEIRRVGTLLHNDAPTALAWSPGARMLATGAGGVVSIWAGAGTKEGTSDNTFDGVVTKPAAIPRSSVSCGRRAPWVQVAHHEEHGKYAVKALAFSEDGRWLVSGAAGPPYVVVYHATALEVRLDVDLEPPGAVSSLAFTPDSKYLVVGMGDGSVRVVEVASWRQIHTVRSNGVEIDGVAVSDDGLWLAIGDDKGTVTLALAAGRRS